MRNLNPTFEIVQVFFKPNQPSGRLKTFVEFTDMNKRFKFSISLTSTANAISSGGATAALSARLTQIRGYLLASRRLSLSLIRPDKSWDTKRPFFALLSRDPVTAFQTRRGPPEGGPWEHRRSAHDT